MIKKIKNWEQWPFKLLYAPIVPVWVWYMIRARSLWFFTSSNPKLTFGGMEGEPKKEMHELLPPALCPPYFNVIPRQPFSEIQENLSQNNIHYPLIVKPEIGGQGILFRRIKDEKQLRDYHEKIPVEYFIQAFIPWPVEVSLFYYRHPQQPRGHISGFLQKVPMQVVGDGVHTLKELLQANSKSQKKWEEIKMRHEHNFGKVLLAGDIYKLSYAANHNQGAQFIDLKDEINDSLIDMLDEISYGVNDFFYGRYDIMCESIEALKNGKNFIILEYNGCGAEPNHFYDTGYTLTKAWREILKHWKVLFEISRYNHKHGAPHWPFWKGVRFRLQTKKYYKLVRAVDKKIP
ncbi:MAG: hypothetical protein JSS98_20150 [Bacteroidetes bacterium]|nr:hypothetical protein [Bacteroidota bacterium]